MSRRPMAHPQPAGDLGDLTLAEWALAIACGVTLALLGWVAVVFVVAIGTPQ